MVSPVKNFIEEISKAGADIISFHPEADPHPLKVIDLIKNFNCKPGIAIHPHFKVSEFEKYLSLIDVVIVMTVMPGFGGQKFMYDQISKISLLKDIKNKKNLSFDIEVDGGINNKTSIICKENGADLLIAGSYIYGAHYKEYKNLIDNLR